MRFTIFAVGLLAIANAIQLPETEIIELSQNEIENPGANAPAGVVPSAGKASKKDTKKATSFLE